MADHDYLAGSSLATKLPIAAGWCSPAPPAKVYERSKPAGPSSFISQSSLACDPTLSAIRRLTINGFSEIGSLARASASARRSGDEMLRKGAHRVHILEMKGASYRLKHSRRNGILLG